MACWPRASAVQRSAGSQNFRCFGLQRQAARMIGGSAARGCKEKQVHWELPLPVAAKGGSFVDGEPPLRGAAKRGRLVDWEFPLCGAAKRGSLTALTGSFHCTSAPGCMGKERLREKARLIRSFRLPLRGRKLACKGRPLDWERFCCVGLLPCLLVACEHQGLTKAVTCCC